MESSSKKQTAVPDSSAVRTALWRALHVFLDAPPHVLEDFVGLQLAAPDPDWRERPDMDPVRTRPFRASIVARARFIEDLVEEQFKLGVTQYVILGAGLDTFAQRRTELASQLTVFEVDQPATQGWKVDRLIELDLGIPSWLHFVPVDFEAGDDWLKRLIDAGFDPTKPAVVASTGVSMYITKDATIGTLRQAAALAPGTTFAMSFILPIELVSDEVRTGMEMSIKGARERGTPFISFYEPDEIVNMARDAGFKDAEHIASSTLAQRYFRGRADGLRPPDSAEELLVAKT